MNDQWNILEDPSPEVLAFRKLHDSLSRRIRLFGRVVMAQGIVLLASGLLLGQILYNGNQYMAPTIRLMTGRPWLYGLFGALLLVCCAGMKTRNLFWGAGAVLISAAAAVCVPLWRIAWAWTAEELYMGTMFLLPLFLFIAVYLFPLSILAVQLPAFLRWRKLKEWYTESLSRKADDLSWEPERRFGPVMALRAFLILGGVGICVGDYVNYALVSDLSSWEFCTLPDSPVSMKVPPYFYMDSDREHVNSGAAHNSWFSVSVLKLNQAEESGDSGEEAAEISESDGNPESDGNLESDGNPQGEAAEEASEPEIPAEKGMMGETPYLQFYSRVDIGGAFVDYHIRTFEVDGSEYRIGVTFNDSFGDRGKRLADEIMGTITIQE